MVRTLQDSIVEHFLPNHHHGNLVRNQQDEGYRELHEGHIEIRNKGRRGMGAKTKLVNRFSPRLSVCGADNGTGMEKPE